LALEIGPRNHLWDSLNYRGTGGSPVISNYKNTGEPPVPLVLQSRLVRGFLLTNFIFHVIGAKESLRY